MKIYIAGPMRGLPDNNYPAFNDMAQWLTAKGYEVFNPVNELDTFSFEDNRTGMCRNAEYITKHADAVYMLTGWENSTGAQAEWALARSINLQIFYQAGIEDYEWREAFNGAYN